MVGVGRKTVVAVPEARVTTRIAHRTAMLVPVASQRADRVAGGGVYAPISTRARIRSGRDGELAHPSQHGITRIPRPGRLTCATNRFCRAVMAKHCVVVRL